MVDMVPIPTFDTVAGTLTLRDHCDMCGLFGPVIWVNHDGLRLAVCLDCDDDNDD